MEKSQFGITKKLRNDLYDYGGITCFGVKDSDLVDSDDDSDDDSKSQVSIAKSQVSHTSARSISSRMSHSSVPLGTPNIKRPAVKSTYSSTIGAI